jgi:hypothetical protein
MIEIVKEMKLADCIHLFRKHSGYLTAHRDQIRFCPDQRGIDDETSVLL